MLTKGLAGLSAALMLTASAYAADPTPLTIYHSWSTPSEMAALNVLKTDLASNNIGWTEIAIPHDTGANVSLTNMVTGGNPPNVFMNSDPGIIRDLAKQGADHGPHASSSPTTTSPRTFPPTVLQEITVDGKIYKAPAGIHIDGMVYWNMDVAKKAGVDPTKWTSLDDMFADFAKVKAAGFQPLAVGSQDFQVGYLTHALIAAVAGPDIYNRFYGPTVDPKVFDEPALKTAIDWVRKFSLQVDPGSENRAWNDTTSARDHRQGPDADSRRLDEGRVAQCRQGRRQGFRLRKHPRHQGAGGDGRRLELPRWPERRRRAEAGRARIRQARHRSEGDGGLRGQEGLDPGADRRRSGLARRLQQARARLAQEARHVACRTPSTSPTPTGCARSGT